MRLKSNDLVFGIEAKKLRQVFRKCPFGNIGIDFFKEELNLTEKESKKILNQMIKEGYLALRKEGDEYLEFLIKANSIRNAKFIKPILRKIADKYVYELIERSKQMNADDYYIMSVEKIYAFGSYITDSVDCQDIDLYTELKLKGNLTQKEAQKISFQRVPDGRSIMEQYAWATDFEPYIFLKSKNKYLSFHEKTDAENASNGKMKVIWEK